MIKKNILVLTTISFISYVHADFIFDTTFNTGSEGVGPSRPGIHLIDAAVLEPAIERTDFFDIALQSDGKIVTGSETGDAGLTFREPFITRFNANGSLDTSFGTGGYTIPSALRPSNFPGVTGVLCSHVALQPDGKIIANVQQFPTKKAAVARFNSDGSLDTTFNSAGSTPGMSDLVDTGIFGALTVQSDGKILITTENDAIAPDALLVARYNSDGTFDTSFGSGGIANLTTGSASDHTAGLSIIELADGKLLVVGSHTPGAALEAIIIKLNSNGTVDTAFGGGTGFVSEDFGAAGLADIGLRLLARSDGKIVLIAKENAGSIGVARFDADGTPDTTFGTAGTNHLLIPGADGFALGAAHQSDGKILICATQSGAVPDKVFIARVTEDGVLDSSFGTGGTKTFDLDLAGGTIERARVIVAQPGSKFLVCGRSDLGGAAALRGFIARFTDTEITSATTPLSLLLAQKFMHLPL